MSAGIETADDTGHAPRPLTRAGALHTTEEAVDLVLLMSLEDAQVEGEPDFIVELIDLYAEDAPRRLSAIRGALAAGDLMALRRAAHGLKGSSASLGARQVQMLCEKLEQLSGRDFLREGETLLARLGHEFARAMSVFADERAGRLRSLTSSAASSAAMRLQSPTS